MLQLTGVSFSNSVKFCIPHHQRRCQKSYKAGSTSRLPTTRTTRGWSASAPHSDPQRRFWGSHTGYAEGSTNCRSRRLVSKTRAQKDEEGVPDLASPGRLSLIVDFCYNSGFDYEYEELKQRVEEELPGAFQITGRSASYLGAGCFEVMVCGAPLAAELATIDLENSLGMSLGDLQPSFEEHSYSPEGVVIFS
ncbi:hypothetical protein CYMTET_22417, partial [Cymbomonas tetramitiformis]